MSYAALSKVYRVASLCEDVVTANAKRVMWCFFGTICLWQLSPFAFAQARDPWSHRYDGWYWYNPRTAMSSSIHAQADLMRAQGNRAIDFAEARILVAEAVDKELDNWLKHMQVYWKRKTEYEKNRIHLRRLQQIAKDQRLNDQRATKSRIWERVKNNPELCKGSIENGEALNFLLDRLANTVGTYDIARVDGDLRSEDFGALQLSPEQLNALQLCQIGTLGGKIVFRADGSSNAELDWWPFKLRGEEFAAERRVYTKARRDVFEQAKAGGKIDVERLDRLKQAYQRLSKAFFERYIAQDEANAGFQTYRQYAAARAFIHNLGGEITRFQNSGDARVLQFITGFDPEKEGRDVIGLLAYMNRSGVRFAPTRPGDEPAYHTVFKMMRDVYINVAEYDEAVQPRDLTEQLD